MTEQLGVYPKPEHGWTCFHCGETFTTVGSAGDHFGADPSAPPACMIKVGEERGLVMYIRRLEKANRGLRAEVLQLKRDSAPPEVRRMIDQHGGPYIPVEWIDEAEAIYSAREDNYAAFN